MTTAPVWVELLEGAAAVTALAGQWFLQSGLVIAAGLTAGRLLRSRGAALQSVIYRTTLVAACVCPLVTGLLSAAGLTLGVTIMPEVRAAAFEEIAEVAQPLVAGFATEQAVSTALDDASLVAGDDAWLGDSQATGAGMPVERLADRAAQARDLDTQAGIRAVAERSSSSVAGSATLGPKGAARSAWVVRPLTAFAAVAVPTLWCFGAAFLLAQLVVAHVRLMHLRSRAVAAAEEQQQLCQRLSAQVGLAVPAVLTSPFVAGPCLSGVWRPAILLPDELPEVPLSSIFVHELAHLRRHDCLWSMLRQASSAVLYFQPLMWILSQRLETTAEEVCDDHVVKHGADRHSYADILVTLAEWSWVPVSTAAVPLVAFRSMLGHRVARILDRTQRLSLSVSVTGLCLVTVAGLVATLGAGALGPAGGSAERSRTSSTTPSDVDAAAGVPPAEADSPAAKIAAHSAIGPARTGAFVVHGSVIDPRGRSVPGADVILLRGAGTSQVAQAPLAATKADPAGRFALEVSADQLEDPWRPNAWRQTLIAAAAPGFGPAWLKYDELEPGRDNTLRLAADQAIEGRIVDEAGRPLANVNVQLEGIRANKSEDLTAWLASLDAQPARARSATAVAVPVFSGRQVTGAPVVTPSPNRLLATGVAPLGQRVATDAQGRFRIAGVGRERVAVLRVAGSGIATSVLEVASREMAPVASQAATATKLHGARFDFVAQPSRPIRGVVRDAGNGQPIANVRIVGLRTTSSRAAAAQVYETVADAAGQYYLDGLPAGDGNELIAISGAEQPFLGGRFKVPNGADSASVELDITLERGIWISGQLTDKETGEPVRATVSYVPSADSAHARWLSDLERVAARISDARRQSDAEGRFRIVGLPGRGAIEVRTSLERAYPHGQIVRDPQLVASDEPPVAVDGALGTNRTPPTAVREINPAAGVEEFKVDLALVSGLRIPLAITDPRGDPLTGVVASGLWPKAQPREIVNVGPAANVLALWPEEERIVLLEHPERKLGRVIRLSASAASQQPIPVQLEPYGAVTGRLQDGDGQPIRGALIVFEVVGATGQARVRSLGAWSDEDGRFANNAVLPGCQYDVLCQSVDFGSVMIARGLSVSGSAMIDLGDLDITAGEGLGPRSSEGFNAAEEGMALIRQRDRLPGAAAKP